MSLKLEVTKSADISHNFGILYLYFPIEPITLSFESSLPCDSKRAACHALKKSQGPSGVSDHEDPGINPTRVFCYQEMREVDAARHRLRICVYQVRNGCFEIGEEGLTYFLNAQLHILEISPSLM